MHSRPIRHCLVAALAAAALGCGAATASETQGAPVYQIIKATDSRVWRLNTQTGEIAVCSLDGEQLLCTSSAQAITPPARSYAELEAERLAEQRLDAQRREESRRRSLAVLDMMMNAFKELALSDPAAVGAK